MSVTLSVYYLYTDDIGGTQYEEYRDGSSIWRLGVRDAYVCWDVELDATGFDGVEGVNWECAFKIPKV